MYTRGSSFSESG